MLTKRSIAVPEQNYNGTILVAIVGNRNVQKPVAVEVTQHNRFAARACLEVNQIPKPSFVLAQENRKSSDDIGNTIVVHVPNNANFPHLGIAALTEGAVTVAQQHG